MDHSSSSNKPVDVTLFFDKITEAYLSFYNQVQILNQNLSSYSVKKISEACADIRTEQHKLTALDQELINIITLVGNDVSIEPLISEYKKAFSLATSACDDLHTNLKKLRNVLSQL